MKEVLITMAVTLAVLSLVLISIVDTSIFKKNKRPVEVVSYDRLEAMVRRLPISRVEVYKQSDSFKCVLYSAQDQRKITRLIHASNIDSLINLFHWNRINNIKFKRR